MGKRWDFFDTGANLLAQVFVPATASQVENYAFAAIAPVILTANTAYVVNALTGNNPWSSGPMQTGTDVQFDTTQYGYGVSFAYPPAHYGDNSYIYLGPSFLYDVGDTIPEPDSAISLAVGLLLLATARYRLDRDGRVRVQ